MPFCSLKNEHLQELMHDKILLYPNKKIILNAIRQNEITDEELLRKANNTFFTPNEFNHALKDLLNRKYAISYETCNQPKPAKTTHIQPKLPKTSQT